MKTYDVVIRCMITKTERVDAEDESQAVEFAHEQFSVLNDFGQDEDYAQDYLEIKEITGE